MAKKNQRKLPRGIRNKNPGNLEWGSPWQGLIERNAATDIRFCQFTCAAYGIRAIAITLITYQDKYDLRTIKSAIARYAPQNENKTALYASAVSAEACVHPEQVIDFHDYDILRPIVEAIIRHENGEGPLSTRNTWYPDETIDEALRLAGVVKTPSANVLMTPQGATVGVAAGASILAGVGEVVSQVSTAAGATIGLPGWLRTAVVGGVIVAAVAAVFALRREQKRNAVIARG